MSALDGGQPGTAYDAAWWARVHALYEQAFPGLPAKIAAAAGLGAVWAETTTPFVRWEGDRAVGHVGVLFHDLWLAGERVRVAGLHAVCTAADRRREGLARELLTEALQWVDAQVPLAKLHTDLPGVYAPHGFAPRATTHWRSRAEARPTRSRRLRPREDAADAALLRRLLGARAPVSWACATADPGWLVLVDSVLSGIVDGGWRYLVDHDAAVACTGADGDVLVADVVGPALPPVEAILGCLPRGKVRWAFPPDRLEPLAEPVPADAGLMVRGPWPDVPLGISPLWEH